MTMDGMEVIGSHAHPAATSPFLLSSPPLSHHHATFNVQTVQLSFDACLTYNTSTTCGANNTGCISSVNILSGTSPSTSITAAGSAAVPTAIAESTVTSLASKTVPTLTLTALPIHRQCISEDSIEQHQRTTDIDNTELRQLHIEQPSQSHDKSVSIKKRRFQRTNCHENNKECTVECQDVEQSSDEKDKPGDLNTPVTTSGDLPSFFGPAALVEPPPISGILFKKNNSLYVQIKSVNTLIIKNCKL